MENINNIITGLIIPSQVPLNAKEYSLNEAVLKNLGTNNNLAYTYHDGLQVLCQLEKTIWEWREVEDTDTEESGLLPTSFRYPDNLVINDIIYSLKYYNFFIPKSLKTLLDTVANTKVDKVVGKSLVLDTEIAKLLNLDNTKDINKPVSILQEARIQEVVNNQIVDSALIGNVTTSSTTPDIGLGNIHAVVGPGTYPNWGGMVVPGNNQGTLQRVDGDYSVVLVPVILDGFVEIEDIAKNKTLKADNWSYGFDGSINAEPSFFLSKLSEDYLPLIENHNYKYIGKLTDVRSICFYASANVFIGSINPYYGGTWTEHEFVGPVGVAFCRTASESGDFQILDITKVNDSYVEKKSVVLQNDIVSDIDNTIFYGSGGYFGVDGNVVSSDNTYSYQKTETPVIANNLYKYIGSTQDMRYVIFLDKNKAFLSSMFPGFGTFTEFEFKTPNGCKYIKTACKNSALSNFQILNIDESYVLGRDNDISKNSVDYNYISPVIIFGVENDSNSNNQFNREYAVNVYPESFLQSKIPVFINDNLRALRIQSIIKNTDTRQSYIQTLSLKGLGYKTNTFTIDYTKTRISNAKGKAIRVVCCGDSMTALDLAYPDGTKKGGWAYPSMIKELSIKDNVDFDTNDINLLMIGTRNYNAGRTFNYKGSDYTVRSFSEGISGRSACNLLRHAHWATGTNALYPPNVTFSMLGLVTSSGHAYTDSDADKMLIYNTTQKDNWEHDQYTYLLTAIGDTYTGTSIQNTAIDTVMSNLLDNPENLFYSRVKANASGSTYAFSLTNYLATQKTLADDGVTRLVVGSTAGTKVTNVTAADVCTPTHFVFTIGENDRYWFPVTPEDVKTTLFALRDAVHAEFPNIQIAFNNTRMLGSYYPERWSDKGLFMEQSEYFNAFKYNLQKLLINGMGNSILNYAANNCYLLSTYHTMSINSFSQNKNLIDLEDLDTIEMCNNDYNHPGVAASMSIAYQCLSWLYFAV